MENTEKLKEYPLSGIEHLKVHGRTTECLSPLTLFWTGSAVELNVMGSELWVEVESDYDCYEPWISILINSVAVSRFMLLKGRYWICVFRGMNEYTPKNVRIVKEVQPMSSDPGCSLQMYAVKLDGEILPVAEKPYKIEFIGDSITSGEGLVGAKAEEDWVPMWFSAANNYCTLTAEIVNADYRILSQSGWGVRTSWDNNPFANIPAYYGQVCGLLTGDKNKALGAFEDHRFDSWQPDIIVVNLGTNDAGAFHSTEWKDPATGISYKQRLNEDGTFNREDLLSFEQAVADFLAKIRSYNQTAHIIWAYGMIGIPLMPAIYRAFESYTKQSGDTNASIFQLPNTTEETVGARQHPGVLAHQKAAKELASYIKEMLK